MAHPGEPFPLTNALWKTERAKYHLNDLREAVERFCADSHTIVSEEEPEHDQVRYRIHLKQPHVYIYLICGDFLQCLRTALDQAVWSLINHRKGIDSEASEFPVFEVEPPDTRSIKRFNSKVKGLSDSAIAYIKSIQPYNRPTEAPLSSVPLWRLHWLNRIDKHRRISIRSQVSIAGRNHFGAAFPRTDFAHMYKEKTYYGYDVLCQGSYKHLQPQVTSFVEFGEKETGIIMSIDDIGALYDFVHDEVLIRLAALSQ
jgi:hypothetical protein